MNLLELQRRMAADIMRPLTSRDNLSPQSKAGDYITPNDRLTSHERLEIYSRSYWYRILDSLYEDFPGLRAIIGDDAFHRLSRAYLAAHPSESFTLRNLGRELPSWLCAHRRYTGRSHALALDMVRLEWAHIEAFDGLADKPLGPEDLLELGPELRMSLQPYISLLELHYPVDELRIRLAHNQDLRDTASNAPAGYRHRAAKRRTVRREKAPIHVAVHRFDDMVYYRRLEPEAYRILLSLQGGDAIGVALEKGFGGSALSADDFEAGISRWFAVWAELGWLCRNAGNH